MFNQDKFDTPAYDIPRYIPGIGIPKEMSPINDVTHDYENDTPPVIEVTPDDDHDEPISQKLKETFLDRLF